MIIVNTDREKFITGSYNNKNFNVPYEEELYSALKEHETQANSTDSFAEYKVICESMEKVLTELNIKDKVEALAENVVKLTATGKYHITINGMVFDKVHIPEKIMDLIQSNVERGIEISPLVNLCIRFMLNPKPTQKRFNMLANYITATYTDFEEVERLTEAKFDIEVAKKLATYPDMQITAEGYIKTSKVVEEVTKKWSLKLVDGKPVIEDGKPIKELVDAYAKTYSIDEETGEVTESTDYPEYMEDRKFRPAIYRNGDQFTSGGVLGYKYEIGKLAQLPSWDMVSMTDGDCHEKGLHIGGLMFVDGYLRGNRTLLDVFVCPSKIGKFTQEGIGEMTAREFYIYGSSKLGGNLRSMYHTSNYSAIQKVELMKELEDEADKNAKSIDSVNEDFEGKVTLTEAIIK